jgi:tripartite-type tricarboxylate transporter receptor subunit TctC
MMILASARFDRASVRCATLAAALSLATLAGPAQAQVQVQVQGSAAQAEAAWPSKPIRVIVPSASGSATDTAVRKQTNFLTARYKWQFIVENKPGANGFIAVAEFLRAPADGYTLFGGSSTTVTANPVVFKSLPYNPVTDFVPVFRSNFLPYVLMGAPKHKLKSVDELVTMLRAAPGKLSYASYGSSRGSAEMFLQSVGGKAVHVPYKSNPPALVDLAGGHIDYMFGDMGGAKGLFTSGQLQPLAVTAPKRLKSYPNVPTMIEAGFPNFEMSAWTGYFAPRGISPVIVRKFHAAASAYFKTREADEYVESIGGVYVEVAPAEFGRWIEDDIALNRAVYRRASIDPE